MDKKRYYQIDFAKAIGIFLVILAHVIFNNKIQEPYLIQLNLFINSFHMPLFFILSGLNIGLSQSSHTDNDNKKQIKIIFKKVLFPYMIWSFIYIILFSFYLPYDFFAYDTVGEKIYSSITFCGITPLWFLATLFLAQLIFKPISRLDFFNSYPKISHTLFLLISFCLSIFINKEFQPYPVNLDILSAYPIIGISRVFPTLLFLEIGFLTSKIWEKFIKLNFSYRFLSFLLNILVLYFIKDLFLYKNFLSFFIIQDMQSFILTGIIGSYSVICFSCLFNKEFKIISEIGKRTLDIMALHHYPIPIAYFLSYIFALIGLKNYVFIYSFLLLTICYLVSKILCDKIRLQFNTAPKP